MDLIKKLLQILKNNVILFIVLVFITVAASISHYLLQKITFTYSFNITQYGYNKEDLMNFFNFRSSNDNEKFELKEEKFELDKGEFKRIKDLFQNLYSINYEQTGTNYIEVNLTYNEEIGNQADELIQSYVNLLNSSKALNRLKYNEINTRKEKISYLEQQLKEYDSYLKTAEDIEQEDYILTEIRFYEMKFLLIDLKYQLESYASVTSLNKTPRMTMNKGPFLIYFFAYLFFGIIVFVFLQKKRT